MKLLIALLLCTTVCTAQTTIEQITNSCSTAELKTNLYHLASAQMEGRLMGSHGDTLAAKFVAGWFKTNKLAAPYAGGSYFQDIIAQKKNINSMLKIGNNPVNEFDGWSLYPHIDATVKNARVLFIDYDKLQDFFADAPHIDFKGKAVLLSLKNSRDAFFFGYKIADSVEHTIKAKGGLMIIYTTANTGYMTYMKEHKFLPEYVAPKALAGSDHTMMPEVYATTGFLSALLAPDNITIEKNGSYTKTNPAHFFDLKTPISLTYAETITPVHAPNVIGIIKGTDPTKACIVVSAHHDHDGRDGDKIYYGAVDNGSGTSAIMEMAAMMQRAVKQGLKPARTIVFASFTGEERGLLGSSWYVDHPLYTMDKTYAVIDIDMFGRVDTLHAGKKADSTNYAYVLVKDTLQRGLRKALYDANDASAKLVLDTYYENPKYAMRRITGSDQYPFYLKGVPFLRVDCGFCKDYHQPTDTPDKINYDILTKQTKLAFMTIWNLATR